MAQPQIQSVTLVGAGTMGGHIASLIAIHGYPVTITDMAPEALDRARSRIQGEILPALHRAGHGTVSPNDALANVRFEPDLAAAVSGVDLVIEAVKEDLNVKTDLFGELDRLNPTAILATNSSSIPSSQIIGKVTRRDRVLNAHFFAPIWVRTMVELMSCGETDPTVIERLQQFTEGLGLVTAIVRKESKGFIINRVWRAVKRESLRVIDEGVADPQDVDRLWMIFFQTEYPPFGVMDFVGLDVVRDIEWSYQRISQDPTDVPSPELTRMVEAGKLGEKSGEGFYQHPNPAYKAADFLKSRKQPAAR